MDSNKNEADIMIQIISLIRSMKEIKKETIEEIKQLSNETKYNLIIELINGHNYHTKHNTDKY
jgi:hypothetical protein